MTHILSAFETAIQEEYKATTHYKITINKSDSLQEIIDKEQFLLGDLDFIKGHMCATLASFQQWYFAFTSNVKAIKVVLDDIGSDLAFVIIMQYKNDEENPVIGRPAYVVLFAKSKEQEYVGKLKQLAKLRAFA